MALSPEFVRYSSSIKAMRESFGAQAKGAAMQGSVGRLRRAGVPALCLSLLFALASPAIGAEAPAGNAPAPASPAPAPAPNPGANDKAQAPNDVSAQTVDVVSKPAAILSGK